VIFEEGEPGEDLFVVQSGEVELSRRGSKGQKSVARLGPGDSFGETSVLVGARRSVRATAIGETRVLPVDGSTLEAMCLERPEVGIRLIRRLASRVIDLEKRLAALGGDGLVRPVVRVLMRHAEPTSEGARVATSLRRIAEEAGLSMLEAHRAFQQLLDDRSLRLVDDVVCIPDPHALAGTTDSA
jgi:CRP-like cAMP-binding protein